MLLGRWLKKKGQAAPSAFSEIEDLLEKCQRAGAEERSFLENPPRILIVRRDITKVLQTGISVFFAALCLVIGLVGGYSLAGVSRFSVEEKPLQKEVKKETTVPVFTPVVPNKPPATAQATVPKPAAVQPEKPVVSAHKDTVKQAVEEDLLSQKVNELLQKIRQE